MVTIGIALLAVTLVGGALIARERARRRIALATAPCGPSPLDCCVRVPLGGARQSVLLRAADIGRPVLLYLHGGPGDTFFLHARSHLGVLEERFVVASWAQRGCLGSYRRGLPQESMTPDQLVSDAVELIEYLRARFGVDRVYVLGGSWGSVLGVLLAARRPELLHAYIGKAQVVSHPEADSHAIGFVLAEADRRGDRRVRRNFETMQPPLSPFQVARLGFRVARYGGYGKPQGSIPGGPLALFVSPDYSLADLAHWLTNPLFGAVPLMRRTAGLDLREVVSRVEVPVYILQGSLDVMAPVHLVEDWIARLDAPRGKHLFRFEGAGHNPIAEEPERAAEILDAEILGGTPA